MTAIQKVMDFGHHRIYNICGNSEISASKIYQLVKQREHVFEQEVAWKEPVRVTLADDSLIRRLEWCDTKSLEDRIANGRITYERVEKAEGQKHKKIVLPEGIRHLFENLLVFVFFFVLNNFLVSNSLFANLDIMRIYVILIAISYGVRQSHMAIFLASAAYMYSHGIRDLGIENFYLYAASILNILEYVFTGYFISYAVDALKEQAKNHRLNFERVKEEYDDLNIINKENVLIKKEYELRILAADSGLSKLYTLINRLLVQDMEHIVIEIMLIIADTVRTDTVAIYSVDFESNCLRLVNAMSDDSAVYGEDWDMSESQHIFDAVMRGEFYQGELGSDEPAVLLPVICHDVHEAVIVIKTLPYECETLYHVNLLKTMALLLQDSMEKALDYYDQEIERQKAKLMEKQKRSAAGSGILEPYDFCDRLLQAEMKAATGEEQHCVFELEYSGNIEEIGAAIGGALENTGCLGFDDTGKLFALLTNASAEDLDSVQDFFSGYGLNVARVVTGEKEPEASGQEQESERAEPVEEEQKRGAAGPGILEPYDFCDRLLQAEMQAVTGEGQYCVFELEHPENIEEVGAAIGEALESTGCLGFDDTGKLFALLNNVTAEDLEFVQDFFSGYGLTVVRPVTGGMMEGG